MVRVSDGEPFAGEREHHGLDPFEHTIEWPGFDDFEHLLDPVGPWLDVGRPSLAELAGTLGSSWPDPSNATAA